MPSSAASTPADTEHDVAVVGAGPAGLAAAALLAREGARVALIGPEDANAGDQRTSALFAGSISILEHAGVWPGLMSRAASLEAIRIVDRLGRADYPSVVMFRSQEIGHPAFGYNIANPDLTRALEDCFVALDGTRRISERVATFAHQDDCVRLECESGLVIRARLVVAADGHDSRARAAAGITTGLWDYGQHAIACRIVHERSHDNISTEIHRPGGPLTSVPLPRKASAIIWLARPDETDALQALDERAFAGRLESELGGFLGAIDMAGPRGLFPVRGLTAATPAAARTALIGEAGHVLPPIGAQGLNLSLRDAAWLAHIVGDAIRAGDDPGAEDVLAAYARARRGDAMSHTAAADLLNRSLLFDDAAVRGLRGIGLLALANIGPLRRSLMRRAIAGGDALPAPMRG